MHSINGYLECEEQLSFEKLLADLSVRFINVPPDQVDVEIEESLRLIGEMLDIDMASLWQLSEEIPPVLVLSHLYVKSEVPSSDLQFSHDDFPWVRDQLLAGQTVSISSLDELPEEAAHDRETALHAGIKSHLSFPLSVGSGPAIGVLVINAFKEERDWPEALVSRLEVLVQILSNAIGRKRADLALRKSEAQLELAAGSANTGLWSLDLTTERYWMTDIARAMFGFSPREAITFPQVLEHIHPEDQKHVREAMLRAMESGEAERVAYRITRTDGEIRWMVSRGRVQYDSARAANLLMGVTLDITETKLRGAALRASEDRLASAVELAELGLYEAINSTHFTFLGPVGRNLIGLTVDEIAYDEILQFWVEHIQLEDRPSVAELQQKLREGELDKVTAEYRYMHPQRGPIWIHHLSHVLHRDADGNPMRTIGVLRDITAQKNSEENLRSALREVQQLRKRLEMENVYLREQLQRDDGQDAIVGESEPIIRMLTLAKQVAPTNSSVLIAGETGTGKELLAQAIHDLSPRKTRAMIKVNCAALPAPLIEGELFGREKGAYTGAMTQQHGRFEVADGSTIFLDEIGDLPLELQAKLLRVLQDGRFERLGSTKTLKVDVRIIAATNHDLSKMVQEGTFREDLFHRLNVFPIEVPPLRMRKSDIPLLTWKFVQEFNTKMGRSIDSISRKTMECIQSHHWPGNVRELHNMVERAMIISEGRSLKMEICESARNLDALPASMAEVERNHILTVLERTHWRIRGENGAAEILELAPTTLHSRMKKLHITRPTP